MGISLLLLISIGTIAQQREYRDPRSFPFSGAVHKPAMVMVTQRSTNWYGDHRRATKDPLFRAQEPLGQPTDMFMTINVEAIAEVETSFERGDEAGNYGSRTACVRLPAGESTFPLMYGLEPGTRYCYRMH